MPLRDDFQFSQSSLQDYVDCARRFELRYVENLQWPAVEAEPITERERHLQRGADFHHLAHQFTLGVPAAALTAMATDDDLRRWWQAWLGDPLVAALPEQRHAEVVLSTPVQGHRLLAKYDLLAVEPGQRAVIVDWKTSQRKPTRAWLEGRLQTVVYRYVLAEAGAQFFGGRAIPPEQVEMVYWFATDPQNPESFPYGATEFRADGEQLAALVAQIKARKGFDLTTETGHCRFCVYRSLCERGIQAGAADELDTDFEANASDWDFDFDQIAEIEF